MNTYAEAKKLANKKNAGIMFCGDAGNGHTFEVYFCAWRNRQVWATVTADGIRIY
jgi:hypothetical protein